jgi:hypothetical protein
MIHALGCRVYGLGFRVPLCRVEGILGSRVRVSGFRIYSLTNTVKRFIFLWVEDSGLRSDALARVLKFT